jgi:COP9 signalosome complex subunit 2
VNKGTYLLEVYALEIAMYSATKNPQKMREAYSKSQSLGTAIQDPRIMGGIHESGGKMYMEEGRWQEAYDEFFHGFRSMQEAGDSRAKQVLKYVVLANILALSKINPFDSREAKVFQSDDEIKTMLAMRAAFENSEIREFEKLLSSPAIAGDAFVQKYLISLLTNIRSEAIRRLIKPYNRISLVFLGQEVGVDQDQVEQLVVQLILDGKLPDARIDQDAAILDLGGSQPHVKRRYDALQAWTRSLSSVSQNLNSRALASSSLPGFPAIFSGFGSSGAGGAALDGPT